MKPIPRLLALTALLVLLLAALPFNTRAQTAPTLTDPIPTGHHPTALAHDGSALWVISQDAEHNVQQIDPTTGEVLFQFYGGAYPQDILFDGSAVWVSYRGADAVQRIDPTTHATLSTPASTSPRGLAHDPAHGLIWVANTGFDLLRAFDHHTTDRLYTVSENVIDTPRLLALEGNDLWIAGIGQLQRVDLATRTAEFPHDLPGYAYDMLHDGKYLWLTTAYPFALVRITQTGAITTYDIGVRPFALASGGGSLWLSDYDTGTLYQLDPDTGLALQTISLGYRPHALLWANDRLWIADILGDSVQALIP